MITLAATRATVAEALRTMGDARAIIATVTSASAMQEIASGLGPNGVMMVFGAVGSFPVDTLGLLGKRAAVKGWYSGVAADSEDTLTFSKLNGVTSMNEIFPFEEAQGAYDHMMSGKARFRVVLKMRTRRRRTVSGENAANRNHYSFR
jgi:alcohol dehydrogenase